MAMMASVPRHDFVPAEFRGLAYLNVPLPIGFGETISQPFIVALMTELLEVNEPDSAIRLQFFSKWQTAGFEPAPHVRTTT
jgi:protein-L-isoaspartate(D-aspartate) O-methyltransferase